MRFPIRFKRSVGGNGPQVGSDSVAEHGADCEFSLRLHNTNGYPVQRLALGLLAPVDEAEVALDAKVYVRDDDSGRWLRCETRVERVLAPGCLEYFDIPISADHASSRHGSSGALDLLVIVSSYDGRELPPGDYEVVGCGDVSSPAE